MKFVLAVLMAVSAQGQSPAPSGHSEFPAMEALSRMAPGSEVLDFDGMGKQSTAKHIGVPILESAYALDKLMNVHKKFTRDVVRVDPRPLHEQAAQMQADIRSRFLIETDKLFLSQKPMSMGDMNIWQGAYAAMAILKYSWDERHSRQEAYKSLYFAEKAFDGLQMMYKEGLPLIRGIMPAGMENSNGTDKHRHEKDGKQWLEDASIDSASGWLLGVVVAERYLPTRQREARELLQRFSADLIANGFQLKNSDGTKTRYGNMGGGALPPPPGVLMSLAALNQSARHSPQQRYNEALEDFTEKQKDVWASYAGAPTLWRNSSTNHNIGFLALTSALLSEQDARRWLLCAQGMVRLSKVNEKAGNSFWLYLTYWALEQRPEMLAYHADDRALSNWMDRRQEIMALARKSMLEFQYPKNKLAYEKLNSKRNDLKFVKWPISGQKTLEQPLPVHERPAADFIWQRNQYALDDWGGAKDKPAHEFNGMDFLFAYYLALHTGAIDPAQ